MCLLCDTLRSISNRYQMMFEIFFYTTNIFQANLGGTIKWILLRLIL